MTSLQREMEFNNEQRRTENIALHIDNDRLREALKQANADNERLRAENVLWCASSHTNASTLPPMPAATSVTTPLSSSAGVCTHIRIRTCVHACASSQLIPVCACNDCVQRMCLCVAHLTRMLLRFLQCLRPPQTPLPCHPLQVRARTYIHALVCAHVRARAHYHVRACVSTCPCAYTCLCVCPLVYWFTNAVSVPYVVYMSGDRGNHVIARVSAAHVELIISNLRDSIASPAATGKRRARTLTPGYWNQGTSGTPKHE
jgi:hypothetical protein